MEYHFNTNKGMSIDEGGSMYSPHPVMTIFTGTTAAEVALKNAHAPEEGVPFRPVFIDAMSYDNFIDELHGRGYSKVFIEKVIPVNQYFELRSPFNQNFDFSEQLHTKWNRFIFEPELQKRVKLTGNKGCGGIPAAGPPRVHHAAQTLREWVHDHLTQLTQVDSSITLSPGVIVFFFTTFRGGTGTGTTLPIAATIKQGNTDLIKEIHVKVMMPDIFGQPSSNHYANAYAALVELQQAHRWV